MRPPHFGASPPSFPGSSGLPSALQLRHSATALSLSPPASPSRCSAPGPTQGLDMDRLLALLQRGGTPGANTNVTFLCQKYTSLLERFHVAEDEERSHRLDAETMEAQAHAERAEEDAERRELECLARTAEDEQHDCELRARDQLRQESCCEESARRYRTEAQALAERKRALSEQCVSERGHQSQATVKTRHMELLRGPATEELRRLQLSLRTLESRHDTVAKELENSEQRALRDEARAVRLRDECQAEQREREAQELRTAEQKEERKDTLREVAEAKERLAEVETAIRRRDDEQHRRAEREKALRNDLQRREAWFLAAAQKVEGLQGVEKGLDRVLQDTAQAQAVLPEEQVEAHRLEVQRHDAEKRLLDSERAIGELAMHLEQMQAEEAELTADVEAKEEQHKRLENVQESLLNEQMTHSATVQNLELELAHITAENDQLCQDRDELLVRQEEARQKLQLLQPSHAETKRRLKEVELALADASAVSTKERAHAERLEREVVQSESKTAQLREQNARLLQQCEDLEGELAQRSAKRTASLGAAPRRSGATARYPSQRGPGMRGSGSRGAAGFQQGKPARPRSAGSSRSEWLTPGNARGRRAGREWSVGTAEGNSPTG